MENMPSPEPKGTNMRSAGFHVHVGFEVTTDNIPEDEDIARLIKTMDLFLGVPSVILDGDTTRRQLYGKAGEYRVKYNKVDEDKYLVIPEYRVLGSNLLAADDLIIWVFNQTVKAIEAFNNEHELPGAIVHECINNHLKKTAIGLCKEYGITYPEIKVNTNTIIYLNSKVPA